MKYLITFIALIIAIHCGCAAVLVGGLLYKSSKSKEAKREFISNLQKTNLEREKAGLQPLDTCTEKYYFDKGWADDDPVCAERIQRYEAGDTSALGTQELETQVELGTQEVSEE